MLQERFDEMCATGILFRSSVSGYALSDIYLRGFGNDPVFRDPNSSVHNCNACKNFIHRYGNIVALDKDLNVMTMFDIPGVDEEYRKSFSDMSEELRSAKIAGVFVETYPNLSSELVYERPIKDDQPSYMLGLKSNVKCYTKEEADKYPNTVKENQIVEFHHLSVRVPREFIHFGSESVEAVANEFRTSYEMFKAAVGVVTEDVLDDVVDLNKRGALLNGDMYMDCIDGIRPKVVEYAAVPEDKRDNWCWVNSHKFRFARFKNNNIGKLCLDLASGESMQDACREYNMRVDPKNFMKAKAPISRRQIEEAEKFVYDNGYAESFDRRCATIDDIKVSDILHINNADGSPKRVSIFDGVKPTENPSAKIDFKDIEEVGIEKFMCTVLPECSSVEAYLTNGQRGNLVTMTTSASKDSKPIFKWPNNYSWTYNGNLAGKSQIREEVKKAGGVVDAPFRFSIMWNEDGRDIVDLDAHCKEPDGHEIYYVNKCTLSSNGGMLDVDKIRPPERGVENIYWKRVGMDGTYVFFVENFDGEPYKNFKAEIFVDGDTYTYFVDRRLGKHEQVEIARVVIRDGRMFDISHSGYLVETDAVKSNLYGLDTNMFHKVNLVCLSPNHWDSAVGAKHYFFMLEGCKAPEKLRGFHNENLVPELLKHRKVMEVLANTRMVESTEGQLSGLGFNSTMRDELIVRVKTNGKTRVMKIKF